MKVPKIRPTSGSSKTLPALTNAFEFKILQNTMIPAQDDRVVGHARRVILAGHGFIEELRSMKAIGIDVEDKAAFPSIIGIIDTYTSQDQHSESPKQH
jgi:hypothetical protein